MDITKEEFERRLKKAYSEGYEDGVGDGQDYCSSPRVEDSWKNSNTAYEIKIGKEI